MAGQNRAGQRGQTEYREREARSRRTPAAAGEARCEVTSHKPHSKILINKNGLL